MFTSVLVIAGASTGRRLADAGRATRDGVGRRRRAIPRAKPEITLHIVQLICSSTFARCPGPSLRDQEPSTSTRPSCSSRRCEKNTGTAMRVPGLVHAGRD